MLNKKFLLVFLVVVVFSFISGTAMAQDEVFFQGIAEFSLGGELGFILNSKPDSDQNSVSFGINSDVNADADIIMKFLPYKGDDKGLGKIEAEMNFKVSRLLISEAKGTFYDLFGEGNNFSFLFTGVNEDRSVDASVGVKAEFGLGITTLAIEIVDYLSDGVTDNENGVVVADPEYIVFPKTEFKAGIVDLDLSMVKINAGVKFTWVNTIGIPLSELIIWDFYTEDAASSNYKWKLNVKGGLAFFFENFGEISYSIDFSVNQVALMGLDNSFSFVVNGIENLNVGIHIDFNLQMGSSSEISISDSSDVITIQPAPSMFKKLPILIKVAYKINIGIGLIPNIELYIDLAQMVNAEEGDFINLPWHGKLGLDLVLGGDGIFTAPIYVKLTNIPLAEDYMYDGLVDGNNSTPPARDTWTRLIIGFGIKFKF